MHVYQLGCVGYKYGLMFNHLVGIQWNFCSGHLVDWESAVISCSWWRRIFPPGCSWRKCHDNCLGQIWNRIGVISPWFQTPEKLYFSLWDTTASIMLHEGHLNFLCSLLHPLSLGPVYHDGCDCPQPSGSVWKEDMQCPVSFPQIEQDLALFPRVDPDRNALEVPQRFGQRQSLCHYTVKDNKVYGRPGPMFKKHTRVLI